MVLLDNILLTISIVLITFIFFSPFVFFILFYNRSRKRKVKSVKIGKHIWYCSKY